MPSGRPALMTRNSSAGIRTRVRRAPSTVWSATAFWRRERRSTFPALSAPRVMPQRYPRGVPPEVKRKRGTVVASDPSPRVNIPPRSLRIDGEPVSSEGLLTSRQVADALGISIRVLADWRYLGKHLPYFTLGGPVRYRLSDVVSFLERNRSDVDPDGVLTPREREALGRHLRRVIDVMAERGLGGVDDLASFVIAGGVQSEDPADSAEDEQERRTDF